MKSQIKEDLIAYEFYNIKGEIVICKDYYLTL